MNILARALYAFTNMLRTNLEEKGYILGGRNFLTRHMLVFASHKHSPTNFA